MTQSTDASTEKREISSEEYMISSLSSDERYLGKIMARLENLASRSRDIDNEEKAKITRNIALIHEKSVQRLHMIFDIQRKMEELSEFSKEADITESPLVVSSEAGGFHKESIPENTPIFPRNQEMIDAIQLCLEVMTHRLSSTNMRGDTLGDGSFVVKTFRPFLIKISHEILEKNRVDIEKGVSWSDMIALYDEYIEDMDVSRRVLINHLKKYTDVYSSPKHFFVSIAEVIEALAEHSIVGSTRRNALVNVREAYFEFLRNLFF